MFQALIGKDEPLNWGSEEPGQDSKIIPPERVGSGGAPPDNRDFGAVMEERNLVAGQIMVKDWKEKATETWDLVRKANGIV